MGPIAIVFSLGVLGVLFAFWLAQDVLRRDRGTPEMQVVSNAIYEGAMAFMRRQYGTIIMLALVGCVVVGALIAAVEGDTRLGISTAVSFLVGAGCSALAGFIGMYISIQANIRAASAARFSLDGAVQAALRGGAVSGFLVVALSLLGVAAMFVIFGGMERPDLAPFQIVGFGFGASFVALFAQLGGGIYTKAADVGADLVGKIEVGIPEDDPRNAAVIADLVGDNVGDCAGRGADLFESTAAESIGAMILGVAVYAIARRLNLPNPEYWVFFPLVVRALGIVASAVGLLIVKAREGENAMHALNRGYYLAAGLSAVFMVVAAQVMLGSIWFGIAGVIGIATSIAFVLITQYYTSGTARPVQEIARASLTGPATNIIAGTAVGFECTASTAISISVALVACYWAGIWGVAELGIKIADHSAGVFGTAVGTMGMLMTAAYILAMDTFGPITDNAGGIVEMSHQPESTRAITDELDSVGNTTKALTKGYAIGSAALAAFLLFSAYIDKVNEIVCKNFRDPSGLVDIEKCVDPRKLVAVDLANVNVFVASLLGAMLVYLFSSLAIRAVGRASQSIILEVRRQFREDPGIMLGTSRPDYTRCVDITTRAALKEMVAPGLLAIAVPIIIGVVLKHQAVAGMLMVGTITGVILATVLNNSGGAWDNAKKYIEAGFMKDAAGNVIGKGTPTHAASVVGDTVGDPYKDTAGPSLHVLVKLLSTITLVMAPLFIG
ncbi:MAG: sodium-translocating pyrophosphatase [Chloroflexota bacterium]|nr:MAG: sodium-translocating pyrophosphatase [Chloroflexota bacterium]